jgi:hypothetical protein
MVLVEVYKNGFRHLIKSSKRLLDTPRRFLMPKSKYLHLWHILCPRTQAICFFYSEKGGQKQCLSSASSPAPLDYKKYPHSGFDFY